MSTLRFNVRSPNSKQRKVARESRPRFNKEGLTYYEWTLTARKKPSAACLKAWLAGEDPTEWAARNMEAPAERATFPEQTPHDAERRYDPEHTPS